MFRSIRIFVLVCFCGVSITFISGGISAVNAYDVRWGTAPAGGVWQALGAAMVEDLIKSKPGLRGSTMPIGGAANVVAVDSGKINAAFSFSNTAAEAWEGKEDFKDKGELKNIRQLAVLFPEPTQIAVWGDSSFTDITHLKGKRITPGPKGSAIAVVSRYVMEAYGMSPDDFDTKYLSFAEAGQQFIDGHIDCILYGAMAYPAPPLVSAGSQRKIRLLPLSQEAIKKIIGNHKGLDVYTLPKGAYPGVEAEIPGVSAGVVVIVRKDMPDDVAYAIVENIDKNFEKYSGMVKAMALGKREMMPQDIGVPMHPAAEKYYREKGWRK
ncbi:MAG: TAXI family TRAP transporter solute-binding subunit [Deltaproteobacteria bacterium]|nr:TAXI family TRAP transporter solute-binding subunit [Deltaproteobacteria bacterium]